MTTLGTLTGTNYRKLDGSPGSGSVLITTNIAGGDLRDPVGNVIWSGALEVPIVDGTFSVTLPPTDDATLSASGFVYVITEQLKHKDRQKWRTVTTPLPGGASVNMADLASGTVVPPSPPEQPVTLDAFLAFQAALPTALVSQVNDPTSDLRLALDALYGAPVPPMAPEGLYNLTEGNSSKLRTALLRAQAGTGFADFAFEGHSIVAGTGAVAGASDFPTQLRALLNTAGYATAGNALALPYQNITPSTPDPRWAMGSGWNYFGGVLAVNSTNDNPAVYTSTETGPIVKVYYFNGAGSFNVTIDGGSPVTVTGPGGNSMGTYTVTGLANTTHTVSITRVSGDAYVYGVGVLKSATTGVRTWNAAVGGSGSGALAAGNSGAPFQAPYFLTAIGMDVMFLMCEANDANSGLAASTFKTNMQTAINLSATGGADVILVLDPEIGGSGAANQPALDAALYELADSNDLPLYDPRVRLGTYAEANAAGFMFDTLHPTASGYAEIAAGLLEVAQFAAA